MMALREQRGNHELLARITGEHDDRPKVTVNLIQTPIYFAVRSVFFEVLEPRP
jgi:hypothetical protein